jgi:hypothetical protein
VYINIVKKGKKMEKNLGGGVNDPKHSNYRGTPIFRAPKLTQINIEKKCI